jgi:hypothetical protein
MNCRVDSDAYGYAIFGVTVLGCLGYALARNFVDNVYKRKAEMMEVALHYALDEAVTLRSRLHHIRNVCAQPVYNSIPGTVDIDGDSEDVGSEDEPQQDE